MAADHTSVPCSILFTIPNFITAGSGRAMVNIIERLDRSRFSPAVCVRRKGGALDRYVEELGIPLLEQSFTVPARPYATLLMRARRAAREFRPYGFDLWHSFHYSDDFTEPIIARMAGAKGWVCTKKNMNWHRRSWYARMLLAKRVAAQNTDMMQRFFKSWPFHKKARLIPRGVVTDRFSPDVAQRLNLRDRLGIAPDRVVVSCVAQLVKRKGQSTLLTAVADVPGVELLLAGSRLEEDFAASLETQAAELGIAERVHFLGHVGDVPALLAETDVFVLPTRDRWGVEGCPVALLEAMACGVACVATDVAGSRDLIVHEQSGCLIAPDDPKILADALNAMSRHPSWRQALGVAARQRVLERFSIEAEVAAHEALYREIVQSRQRHQTNGSNHN